MNRKGFTLVELIGVIIILGILLLISIPAISGVIFESKESVYANNIKSMITNVETLYQEKKLGSFLDDDQLLLFPIKLVEFDRNDNKSSPFDDYDFSRSFIIIKNTKHSFKSYASVIDRSNRGILNAESTSIEAEFIVEQDPSNYKVIMDYYTCDIDLYDLLDTTFEFNGEEYVPLETRELGQNLCSDEGALPIIVFEKK